jgi:hypothetical protein
MELAHLAQPPLATTLMGCVKGASDWFGNDLSTPMLFGLSGHAFFVNIHREMCPSAPYVWKKERFYRLLEAIGIEKTADFLVTKSTPEEERRSIEQALRSAMDDGKVCLLTYLEHQLACGYDENGLKLLQPWQGKSPSEVRAVTFGSWDPCLAAEGFAEFAVLARTKAPARATETIRGSLSCALDMYRHPDLFAADGYTVGHGAWETWIDCAERNVGTPHGFWWNAVVWGECRRNASAFLRELCGVLEANHGALAAAAETYASVAQLLEEAAPREQPPREKVPRLREIAELERTAEKQLEAVIAGL